MRSARIRLIRSLPALSAPSVSGPCQRRCLGLQRIGGIAQSHADCDRIARVLQANNDRQLQKQIREGKFLLVGDDIPASQLETAASVPVDLVGRFTDPTGQVGRINLGIDVAADRCLEEIVREPDTLVVGLPILPGQSELMAQQLALRKRPEVFLREVGFFIMRSVSTGAKRRTIATHASALD